MTAEPPLTVAPVYATSSKIEVPAETATPDVRVGVEAAETTNELPPEDGVLNAMTSLPTAKAYHVFLLHDELFPPPPPPPGRPPPDEDEPVDQQLCDNCAPLSRPPMAMIVPPWT